MSPESNLKLIQDMYVALNAQDLEAHHKYWHEAMIWHGPPGYGDVHGIEKFKHEVLASFYKAFPDYHVSHEIEFADEKWVAGTGYLTGHQRGEYLGLAPTGLPVKMRFSDFWLVVDGKIKENWVMVDLVDTFKQLGVDLMAQIGKTSLHK